MLLTPRLATLAPVIPAKAGITAADGKLIFVNELSGGQSEVEVA